jgi:hypothetical protein
MLKVHYPAEGEHSRSRRPDVVAVSQCGDGDSDGEERFSRAIESIRGRNRMGKKEFQTSRNEPRKGRHRGIGDDPSETIRSEIAEGEVEKPSRPSEQ